MADALYGPAGFYVVGDGPQRHFRTSATATPRFAAAIGELAARVDASLGRPARFDVVDVGAGDGSLLRGLHACLTVDQSARWRLVGIDLRGRPEGVPDVVGWSDRPPQHVTGLLVTHELLDNVPLDVVEQTAAGPRLVLVDHQGSERLGGPPADDDERWLARWWPLHRAAVGDRAEIGRSRDEQWAQLVVAVDRGVALAVDYAHTREERGSGRFPAGTLTGYRDGHQVAPVPDGSCDLTAHVALDACEAAGVAAGATGSLQLDQRSALGALGVSGALPPLQLAHDDPAGYVRALSEASAAAELLQPDGLGGFGWLLQAVGCPLPLTAPEG